MRRIFFLLTQLLLLVAVLTSSSPSVAYQLTLTAVHNGSVSDTEQRASVDYWAYDQDGDGYDDYIESSAPFPGFHFLPDYKPVTGVAVDIPSSYGTQSFSRWELMKWSHDQDDWIIEFDGYPGDPITATFFEGEPELIVRAFFTDPNYSVALTSTIPDTEVGSQVSISWTADSGAENSTSVTVDLSTDGGMSFSNIGSVSHPTTSFSFTAPATESICQVRLTATDDAGNHSVDDSNLFDVTDGPAAPALSAPTAGWCVPEPMPTTPFSWAGTGDQFNIQVSADSLFGTLALNEVSTSNSYDVPGLSPAMYYWRVNATEGGDTSDWSTYRLFTVVGVNTAAPDGLVPDSGIDADPDGSTSVVFSWNGSSPGHTYDFQLDEGPDFDAPYLSNLTGLTDPTTAADLPDGDYVWRVRVSGCSSLSPWSTTTSFAISNTIPSLISPVAGDAFQSPDEVAFSWTEIPGSFAYRIQISLDPTFDPGALELDTAVGAPPFIRDCAAFLSTGTRYWRVQAYADGGWQSFSAPEQFDYDYRFTACSFLPDQNTSNISTTTAATAILNVAVDEATFTDETFVVSGSQSGTIEATHSTTMGRWLKASPLAAFHPGERVSVSLTSGLESAAAGDPLANPMTYSFLVAANGFAEFHQVESLDQPDASVDACVADLNGDGRLDIASALGGGKKISVILSDSASDYDPYTTYWAGPTWSSRNYFVMAIDAADVDSDGDTDLISANYGDYSISVYINQGNGTFGTGVTYSTGVNVGPPNSLRMVDIDADGDMDAICGAGSPTGDGEVLVFRNYGSGTFASPPEMYHDFVRPDGIVVGDFNLDGTADAVAIDKSTDELKLMLNQGNGMFSVGSPYDTPNEPNEIACADIDGDRDLDLAVCSYVINGAIGTIRVYENDGNGNFGVYSDYSVNNAERVSLSFFDADGDGDQDIVSGSEGSAAQLALFLNDGAGAFADPTYISLTGDGSNFYRPTGLAVGDMSSDGTMDIMISSFSPTKSTILHNITAPPAVTLYSPLDGKPIPHTAPNLDWLPVAGSGITYTAQLDDDQQFGSPILRELVTAADYWTVSPALPEGTYYWRVRASNLAGDGDWSEVRSLSVDIPDPSCPVLFTFDGNGFVHENPLLTACEESGYQDVVTDYYMLGTTPSSSGQRLRFELRELEDEITYLDEVELISIDYPEDLQVTCTADGDIALYRDAISPVAAVDQDGNDVLDLIVAKDGQKLETDGAGHLIVTFPHLAANAVFSTNAAPKPQCPFPASSASQGGEQGLPALSIALLDADGTWKDVADLPSRQLPRQETVATGHDIGSEEPVQIRVSWTDGLDTDVIAQYIATTAEPVIHRQTPITTDTRLADPSAHRPGNPESVVLRNGDVLSFEFEAMEQPSQGTKRAFVIKAVGRYEPDYTVHTSMTPTRDMMHGNYPNPFNPSTEFRFDLATDAKVSLHLYDVRGRLVRSLVSGDLMGPGAHSVTWDGRDNSGKSAASGSYFYRFAAGTYQDTGRVLLVK